MKKPKRKLTAAERKAKKLRNAQFETVFMNGRAVRVRRPPTVDGIPLEDFLRRHADPLWLHANELWEYIETPTPAASQLAGAPPKHEEIGSDDRHQRKDDGPPEMDEQLPF